jgi:hypothetical protein
MTSEITTKVPHMPNKETCSPSYRAVTNGQDKPSKDASIAACDPLPSAPQGLPKPLEYKGKSDYREPDAADC